MPFKICTIGCGDLSTRYHGPAFRRYADIHPQVELTACCDIDPVRVLAFRETFGFRHDYTDWRRMLESEQPDAVCLMAPVALTCEIGVQILEKGFPLLTEKPPGRNPAELEHLIAAAEKFKVPNQVAFNRRYTPLVQNLKQRLQLFSPEAIQFIQYDFFRFNRRDADFSTTAIHGIDTTRFLVGADFAQIDFHYQEFPELGPAVANIFMECTFTSGARARVNFCPVAGVVVERATVHTLDHTFFLQIPVWGEFDTPGKLQHLQQGKLIAEISGTELPGGDETFISNGFYGENAAFFDDLQAGRRPVGDLADARQSVEIADCIRLRKQKYRRSSIEY